MPYRSAKQRAYMHIHHPEIAARWDREFGGKIVQNYSPQPPSPDMRRDRPKLGLNLKKRRKHAHGGAPSPGGTRDSQKQHYVGFNKLKGQLAKRPGVTNPGALAAYIGRKKYGPAKFNAAARSGRKLG